MMARLGMAIRYAEDVYVAASEAMFNKGCINYAKRSPAATIVKWTGYRFNLSRLLDGGLGANLVSANEVKLQSLLAMFKGRGYNQVRQEMVFENWRRKNQRALQPSALAPRARGRRRAASDRRDCAAFAALPCGTRLRNGSRA